MLSQCELHVLAFVAMGYQGESALNQGPASQEVLDNVIPETGALCEAYNDAVYFKCAHTFLLRRAPASRKFQYQQQRMSMYSSI